MLQRQGASREGNAVSVRTELMADCLAGVWAHHAQRNWNILEDGDIQEATNAAAAVGDDRLQQQGSGHVSPDSFTHGTSQQRATWFKTGFGSGTIQSCNTFAANRL